MTHETKAGLLVSCSFVCLVGTVIYLRMTDGNQASAVDTANGTDLPAWPTAGQGKDQVPAVASTSSPTTPGKVVPLDQAPRLEPAPVSSGIERTTHVVPTEPVVGRPPRSLPPPASVPAPPLAAADPAPDVPPTMSSPPAPSPLGATPISNNTAANPGTEPAGQPESAPSPPPPPTPSTEAPAPAPVPEPTTPPAPETPAAPASPVSGTGTPPASTVPPPLPPHETPAPVATPLGETPPPAPRTEPAPTAGGAPPNLAPPPSPSGVYNDPPPPSTPSPSPLGAPAAASPAPAAPAALGGASPLSGDSSPTHPLPSANPLSAGTPPAPVSPNPAAPVHPGPSTPVIPVNPPSNNPGPANPAAEKPTSGGVILGTPQSSNNTPNPGQNLRLGSMPGQSSGSSALADATPPPHNPMSTPAVGAVPLPASAPPLARAPTYRGLGPMPEVESFDEETYVRKPGDTLAGICKEKYASEKYERALLMFNRAHPLAADGIRNEPAVLRPGQPVYLPPLSILEKRYAALIPNLPPPATKAPPAPSTPSTPAGTPGAALPRTPGSASTSWSAPPSDRFYEVKDRPETLWEIATRALGNGERWPDIFRLNPGLPATGALPVGSRVRLPPS